MKGIFASLAGIVFVLALCPALSAAQDPARKIINGGLINGKAVSLPKPAYPTEAREAKAEGPVVVEVIVDENGTVISAVARQYDETPRKNADGTPAEPKEVHPALRQAAETAALGARFSPTLLSGEPVKIKGRIVYNFVAGDTGPDTPGRVNGGILNGKATSLPRPEYPAAALAVRAAGAVTVQVTIDESGNVIAANAVSGHPLLRSAAVTAAREAKFSPTTLSGTPVKVTGVVTYNFAPAKPAEKPDDQ
jgi:TonB family protein